MGVNSGAGVGVGVGVGVNSGVGAGAGVGVGVGVGETPVNTLSCHFKIIVPNIFNPIIIPLHLFLQSKCLPIF